MAVNSSTTFTPAATPTHTAAPTSTLTPLPTTLPTPSPIGAIITTLPLPPAWDQDDTVAILQGNIHTIGKLINWVNGDIDAFFTYLDDWILTFDAEWWFNCQEYPVWWYKLADFDHDDVQELILTTPSFRWNGGKLQGVHSAATSPVFTSIFEQENNLFFPAYQFESQDLARGRKLNNARLFAYQDLNNDGLPEIVLSEIWCGAHTCGTYLSIGNWDGGQWRDLGVIRDSYNEISIIDENKDGVSEIKSYGGTVGSSGGGLQRKKTNIYEWQDGRYRLTRTIPNPSEHPYYLVLDAHTALANDDYDLALELAMRVINMPEFPRNDYTLIDDWAEARIASFARIEAMLVYAQFQDVDAMRGLLDDIVTEYDELDNPYAPAARILFQTYQDTRDPVAACQAMADRVQANPAQAEFFQWYGYATERIKIEDICPLSE